MKSKNKQKMLTSTGTTCTNFYDCDSGKICNNGICTACSTELPCPTNMECADYDSNGFNSCYAIIPCNGKDLNAGDVCCNYKACSGECITDAASNTATCCSRDSIYHQTVNGKITDYCCDTSKDYYVTDNKTTCCSAENTYFNNGEPYCCESRVVNNVCCNNLCGDKCCGEEETCVNSTSCCSDGQSICKGVCCEVGEDCLKDGCCPQERSCDMECCDSNHVCVDTQCCAGLDNPECWNANNGGCCPTDTECTSAGCCSRACNGGCCSRGQTCVNDVCV
jgi:hypothetical protein